MEHFHLTRAANFVTLVFKAPTQIDFFHVGERQNEDWLVQLRSRENTIRVSQSMENRLNPRDTFSREEPEDLFFNPR